MLEAAALKLAVVTTGVCGMRDFIRDGENGLLVPPADPSALAAGLHAAVTNPTLARRLGEGAYRTAAAHTWDRVAEELASAYRAAIRYRARRRGARGDR
jgi:glycosyltransferase involved in cell wall biosynthesis